MNWLTFYSIYDSAHCIFSLEKFHLIRSQQRNIKKDLHESLLLCQSSTAKALNCPLTQELVPPEQVLLLTCITCSGISKIFHSLKLSVWYISTLKKKIITTKSSGTAVFWIISSKVSAPIMFFSTTDNTVKKLTGHILHYRSNSLSRNRNHKSCLKSRKDADFYQHKINTTNPFSS